jgi:hypothetical protein
MSFSLSGCGVRGQLTASLWGTSVTFYKDVVARDILGLNLISAVNAGNAADHDLCPNWVEHARDKSRLILLGPRRKGSGIHKCNSTQRCKNKDVTNVMSTNIVTN